MKMLASLLFAIVLTLGSLVPAHAHRLRVFATVEAGAVVGYAYFVGGGRAKSAAVLVRDNAGRTVYRDTTDADGAFRWTPPKPQTLRISVDAGEGHVATITLGVERFSALDDVNPGEAAARAEVAEHDDEAGAELSEAALAHLEKQVEAAVARQIRPLLEAYEAAEARLRFNDIVGGIGMIVGVAGAALWAASRRKSAAGGPRDGDAA